MGTEGSQVSVKPERGAQQSLAYDASEDLAEQHQKGVCILFVTTILVPIETRNRCAQKWEWWNRAEKWHHIYLDFFFFFFFFPLS
jgi:hypothetical protein